MKIVFLGTGTSQGVPVIGCDCTVCSSADPRDARLRTSAYIETDNGLKLIIDTGPDFRQQLLRSGISDLDAVLFTHAHKDHTAGLDDIRAINHKHRKAMPLYAEPMVQKNLKNEFSYAFADKKYPGVPELFFETIDEKPFTIKNQLIQPIRAWHHKLPVLGFGIGRVAYITDTNRIDAPWMKVLKKYPIVVLNALRHTPHLSHFNLEQALEVINTLKPKAAYLTHISHLLGLHHNVQKTLPDNVFLAYDGLSLTV